jgi:hypothetical protein
MAVPSVSFAQSSPCSGTTQTTLAGFCDSLKIKDPIAFYIGGAKTPSGSGSSSTGTTASGQPTLCCCASDPASLVKIHQSIKADPKDPNKVLPLASCPDACKPLDVGGTFVRSQVTPEPCGNSLKIDPANSPLRNLSGFIENWYAALFYLAVVLAIIQIFRGGFEYAIAAGNSSKTEEAKGIIVEAVIGLGVALLAAGILVFLRGPGIFVFSS